jgi:photosystem II stability/assembly factor-like uncharacterized protein
MELLMYRHAVLTLACIGLLRAAAGAQEPADGAQVPWSELAPLASRSLLLDADKAGDGIVAVGERGHVLLSTDEGASWRQVEVPARSMLTAVAVAGTKVWAVGHDAVVVHSGDGGRTWSRQYFAPERDAPLLDVWFGDAGRGLAVGAYGLALATEDGGAGWREVRIDPEEDHLNAIVAADDGTLYIPAENGAVFRSRDRAQSWEAVPTSYSGSLFGGVALPNGLLVFGLRGNVFRLENGSPTWERIDTGTDATLLSGTRLADGTVLIVGLSGTVLVSRDEGRRFKALNRPDRRALSAALPLMQSGILLLGEDGVQRVGSDLLWGAS